MLRDSFLSNLWAKHTGRHKLDGGLISLLLFVFRDLLQDKQEELDATQSQAHWIVLQQEAIIADTAKELNEISELVNDLLLRYSEEPPLEEV